MSDLDARVAALKAIRSAATIIGGLPESPGYNGSILLIDDEEASRIEKELDNAALVLEAELQKPALHEPCTFEEITEALTLAYGKQDHYHQSTRDRMESALNHVLQGRAKPAQETSISNIQIIADPSIPKGEAVFKQDGKEVGRVTNIGDAQKPAQEEITGAELNRMFFSVRASKGEKT